MKWVEGTSSCYGCLSDKNHENVAMKYGWKREGETIRRKEMENKEEKGLTKGKRKQGERIMLMDDMLF